MTTIQALVACSDLTGYAKLTSKLSEDEIFHFLADYYEFVGDVVAPARGKVIKFMGDAALIFFPEDAADEGIRAMLALQNRGDRFLSERGADCRHHVRIHFGPMCHGLLGTRDDKKTDVLGSTVNTLFMLKAPGFVLTPEAFRKLTPETRKLFKKHTPPVFYIPTTQLHRN
ncbi:MAG: adenylate/guanylate cyclase domain-containing protein [Methylacidiphilales bacterium]|nr:adenylate/guanylate cyclase domain-containing protein [Candidatus Methylacidiphilales bacterium]